MGRPRENHVELSEFTTRNGRKIWRVWGQFEGKQIRIQHKSPEALMPKFKALQAQIEAQNAKDSQIHTVATRLTKQQIEYYEGFHREFAHLPRPLAEYVREGVKKLGDARKVLVTDALDHWTAWQQGDMKAALPTVASNRGTVTRFLKWVNTPEGQKLSGMGPVQHLSDIHGAHIMAFGGAGPGRDGKALQLTTKLAKIARLAAFLHYCCSKTSGPLLYEYPLEGYNLKQENKAARKRREAVRPVVFKAEAAERLLDAALELEPRFVPYVLLTTWCFMRTAEAERCTPADLRFDSLVPQIDITPAKFNCHPRQTDILENVRDLLRQCADNGIWHPPWDPLAATKGHPRRITALPIWTKIRARAGLVQLSPGKNGKMRRSGWVENMPRHTCISMAYQAKEDEIRASFRSGGYVHGIGGTTNNIIAFVTSQAGNKPEVAYEHYVNLQPPGSAAKFYAIRRTIDVAAVQARIGNHAFGRIPAPDSEDSETAEESVA